MVVYVVVRGEVGLPEWAGRRWSSTEALAHVYARRPDPLQRALLHTFHATPETPKSSRGGGAALLVRALSFKGRLGGKLGGMKSPLRPPGKIVKVEPSGGSESLESKVEHVWRSLDFFRDVVEKRINDMLHGSATVVLEMVVALNLALKPAFSNHNSSAVAAAVAGVNHSLADLVRWSDQHLLHDDLHHNTRTVQDVVEAVRDAVKALVDLAADKNLYIPDTTNNPSSLDNNNSEKSTPYYNKRHSDVSSHRNSLPEIKADSPTERSRNLLNVSDGAVKLSHSRSSDSILTGPDLDTPPPKPPLPLGRSDGAPPLPPKRKNPKVNSVENIINSSAYMNTAPHGTPFNHITPHNHTSSSRNHSLTHNHSNSPLNHSPRESASDQVSPASSLDSMTQEPPASRSSLNSCGSLDFESAIHRHLRTSVVDPSSPRLRDLSSDSGFPSLSSIHSFSSTSATANSVDQAINQSYSQSRTFFSSSSQVSSSRVICTTQRIVSCTTTTRSSTSSSTSCSSTASEGDKTDGHIISLTVPPKLPEKRRERSSGMVRGMDEGRMIDDGRTSTYDNLEIDTVDGFRLKKEDPSPRLPPKTGCLHLGGSSSSSSSSVNSGYSASMISSSSSSSSSHVSGGNSVVQLRKHHQHKVEATFISSDDNPPPLPLKKKHVHDYMKLFGQVSEPNPSELLRHSVHQMHLVSSLEEAHFTDHDPDFFHPVPINAILPNRAAEHIPHQPPPLPAKTRRSNESQLPVLGRQSLPASPAPTPHDVNPCSPTDTSPGIIIDSHTEEKAEPEEVIIQDQSLEVDRKEYVKKKEKEEEVPRNVEEEEEEDDSLLDLLDVKDYLVLKKDGEEGPDIRGGPVDALIVHASKANKNDFLYQEAFLTTYRTFITPEALIKKLLWRYNRFVSSPDLERQKAARNSFSLLVRVVDDLTVIDLCIPTLETLTDFEYTLLCRGELLLARALRKKIVEKLDARNKSQDPRDSLSIVSQNVTTKQTTLLNFKSQEVAEQMTLLDAELFLTMEIPEVLLWAQEQNEERSPNLTTFTEHFNNMSYWARSRILEQEDSRDREKYVMKFIKIMKHLRKMNNFNSYLALLSALDSAPIRRLEWQRTITDGLKEYCALIDSSSSFRAYRQALSDSTPPCIPYIGLILQDLTFVNIGNSDNLPDGNVNFSKRWQQFNILDNMKRFKKGQYAFKKNEDIIAFLNNFEQHLNEEALWSISESIKPRGGKKK
ncbi:hypothetical protein Pmani_013638 [Petrolisthes manimaculis]|uniref:CRK SH3-binding GNRP n=1 Tax=Petrolisthes manimaculis TaxID=1843537 RepID=A0AAE1PY21_9EUCA|nr:hypothetical protein Pmani_013638 [Petrolisthes manimaculis]